MENQSVNKGGRPQHKIREFYDVFLIDTTLTAPARYQISNVDKYVCRGCKKDVKGKELKMLVVHGLKCEYFNPEHKGILSLLYYANSHSHN